MLFGTLLAHIVVGLLTELEMLQLTRDKLGTELMVTAEMSETLLQRELFGP
jgi:hypothetical protein